MSASVVQAAVADRGIQSCAASYTCAALSHVQGFTRSWCLNRQPCITRWSLFPDSGTCVLQLYLGHFAHLHTRAAAANSLAALKLHLAAVAAPSLGYVFLRPLVAEALPFDRILSVLLPGPEMRWPLVWLFL
jgi:hypothetical protein